MRTTSVLAVLGTLVVLAWLYFAQNPTGSAPGSAPPPVSAEALEEPPRRGDTAAPRRSVEPPSLRVVSTAGLVIEGATLRAYCPGGDGALVPKAAEIASTSDSGVVSSEQLADGARRFTVERSGFVTVVVQGGFTGEQTVEMAPAHLVEVSVVSEHGTPLPEARVVLSAKPLDQMQPLESDSAADPLSGNPCWMRSTDALGVVAFAAVPPGTLVLNVFHDDYVPDTSGIQSRVHVDSDQHLTVVAKELWGAAFAIPSQSPVETVSWGSNRFRFDHSPAVLARLGYCRSRFQRRMPEAQVFVHRPASLQAIPEVDCQVALLDGTFWSGRWTLQPLSSLREPVYLEQDVETPRRRVRVELRTKSGELLDIDLTAQLEGSPHRWSVGPGAYMLLAHGRYHLQPQIYAAWSVEAFDGLQFEISDSQPVNDVVTVTLEQEFVPVEVVPIFPDEQIASNIFVSIDDEAKQGLTVSGWNPSRGPILLHAPAGELSILCYSPAYEETRLTTEVPFAPSKRSPTGVSRILMPLTLRDESK